MSLRPPLHVSTFHSRTVVSMFGRLCHLFVHALSSLQVANAQCMTLRSLAPCLRAAREKHRFAAGKKHRNGKKHVWQQEKNALQREKAVSAAGKNASKKCRFAAGKIQSIFPSNAFMAFARSLHMFHRSKKMNCKLSCKAVYTSIASKALVMDQYIVQ